jgi:hypothetical protein
MSNENALERAMVLAQAYNWHLALGDAEAAAQDIDAIDALVGEWDQSGILPRWCRPAPVQAALDLAERLGR